MENYLLALIVIGGIFIAILILLRPTFGLLLLVFITFIRFSDILVNIHELPSLDKIFVPLLGVIFLIRWGIFYEKPVAWGTILLFMTSYIVLVLMSMLYAKFPDQAYIALIRVLKDAMVVLIISGLMRRTENVRDVVWTIIAAGFFLGTVTTYQFITNSHELDFGGFFEAISVTGGGYNRLTGIGIHPNAYAQRLLVVIPLALDRFWNEKDIWLKSLSGWTLSVCTIAVIATYSRGAFLGLVVIGAIMVLFTRRAKFFTIIFTLLFGALVYQYVPNKYVERISTLSEFTTSTGTSTIENTSFRGRISENVAAWNMFKEFPLLGVGSNNFNPNYLKFSRNIGLDSRLEERSPHSLYLEIMAELGIVGLIWLIALLWATFNGLRQAHKDFITSGRPDYANLCLGIGAGIIGYLVAGIFLHVTHLVFFLMLFAISMPIPYLAKSVLLEETDYQETITPVFQHS